MAEIERLPPPYRIPPARPGTGPGEGNQAPQRKPPSGENEQDRRRRRRKGDDDTHHIDEYV
ncbi:MAG: hypothetical protein J5I92_05075 [Thiogranum sp.]|nr:hypothetical protein [Thiogranum sp.]